jgi:hypothetical protein
MNLENVREICLMGFTPKNARSQERMLDLLLTKGWIRIGIHTQEQFTRATESLPEGYRWLLILGRVEQPEPALTRLATVRQTTVETAPARVNERIQSRLQQVEFATKRQVLEWIQLRVDVITQKQVKISAIIPGGESHLDISVSNQEWRASDGSFITTSPAQKLHNWPTLGMEVIVSIA